MRPRPVHALIGLAALAAGAAAQTGEAPRISLDTLQRVTRDAFLRRI